MYSTLGTNDYQARYHLAQLLREAEQERLANLATGPGRPLRGRIADVLVALAEWLDGTPRRTVARAS